jgi:hypothetical protein
LFYFTETKHNLFMAALVVICLGIIAFRFENNSRQISRTRMHQSRATLPFTMAPNTFGSSVWNILHVDIPVGRIFNWTLHLCKIFQSVIYTVRYRTESKCCYHHPVVFINRHHFIYLKVHKIFSVRLNLLPTTCFGCLYWLKSGRIATMQIEWCTAVDASIL